MTANNWAEPQITLSPVFLSGLSSHSWSTLTQLWWEEIQRKPSQIYATFIPFCSHASIFKSKVCEDSNWGDQRPEKQVWQTLSIFWFSGFNLTNQPRVFVSTRTRTRTKWVLTNECECRNEDKLSTSHQKCTYRKSDCSNFQLFLDFANWHVSLERRLTRCDIFWKS